MLRDRLKIMLVKVYSQMFISRRDASLISHGHPFIALKASHLLR